MAPEWLLVVVDFSSVGAALRSSAADLLPRPCLRLSGVLEKASPSPEIERRRLRWLTLKFQMRKAEVVWLLFLQGGGVQAPRSVDFPVARGGLPVQSHGGSAAGFAGAAVCLKMTTPEFGRTSL